MGLGGPVWHASVRSRIWVPFKEHKRMCDQVLLGVGDAKLGEWVHKETALHVRRRLSVTEVAMVGPVEDIRRTPEARERYLALPEEIRMMLPEEIVRDEVG